MCEELNSLNDGFFEEGMVPCDHHNTNPIHLASRLPPSGAGGNGNLNPVDEEQQSVIDGEDCWRQALEGALKNIYCYQERKKATLRNIVGGKESLDKRIYQLQVKEQELSQLFKSLQVENEGLKEVVKMQLEKEQRVQELENDRKMKEGNPNELERLVKLVENKVVLLGSVQQALNQYVKKNTDAEEPRLPKIEDQHEVGDHQQLSDRATMTLDSVDNSYKLLLSCVPVMHQKLRHLQKQLNQERKTGDELEFKMEEIESKLERLSRDLERLYNIYKKAGAHSEEFQITIEDLEISIEKCRENIDEIEKENTLF